jgi:hypothetical protein
LRLFPLKLKKSSILDAKELKGIVIKNIEIINVIDLK